MAEGFKGRIELDIRIRRRIGGRESLGTAKLYVGDACIDLEQHLAAALAGD